MPETCVSRHPLTHSWLGPPLLEPDGAERKCKRGGICVSDGVPKCPVVLPTALRVAVVDTDHKEQHHHSDVLHHGLSVGGEERRGCWVGNGGRSYDRPLVEERLTPSGAAIVGGRLSP